MDEELLIEQEEFYIPLYDFSIEIIDLLISQKDSKIIEKGLKKEIYLDKIYYERSLEKPKGFLEIQSFAQKKSSLEKIKRRELSIYKKNKRLGNRSNTLYLINYQWI